ncbi:uncharacterized protein LOC125652230 isoform X3 [Ostrea edulis]|uniref:uncharacterized protein LOC125652230 isoform X3 n=1 Tax=Ostrea edulis TaxID=37623 RepID=UPI0024AF41AC|nr:uncharacterized protein LOC125652230 isoform X3 [Ostrea edulis]
MMSFSETFHKMQELFYELSSKINSYTCTCGRKMDINADSSHKTRESSVDKQSLFGQRHQDGEEERILQLEGERNALNDHCKKLKHEITEKEQRILRLEKDLLEKDRSEIQMRKSLQKYEEEVSKMKTVVTNREDRCKSLETQIEKCNRKEVVLGFHTTLVPTMSSLIFNGLMKHLEDRLAEENVDLVRRPYTGKVPFNYPLLAVCVNVSRIAADAKEALRGVTEVGNCKDIALLVFHHKDVHALPSQTSDKILTGTEFSHVGLILDFAFLTNRGIYNCELNTLGIERIVTFLLQYKTRK